MHVGVCAIYRANSELLRQFPLPDTRTANGLAIAEHLNLDDLMIDPNNLAEICRYYLTPNPKMFREVQEKDLR